ncbi:MAG: FecR domain-containing protein [Chitinophagaceae bacterium]|nr:FecR domain-containing protein [Chitinophagaceae bacterium]
MQKQYETYDTGQFLDDPDLISWVKYRKPEQEAFWQSFIDSHPANLKELQQAIIQLELLLSAERISVPEGDEERIWKKIEDSIENTPVVSMDAGNNRKNWWWAVAAAVLLVAGGIYFFHGKEDKPVAQKYPASKDGKPSFTSPVLTLADGSTLVLDSVNKGTISQQGNTKLINMNGWLSYQQSGSSSTLMYNTISTPRGGMYTVVLSDGTKVWLNAMSSLRFPASFGEGERRVEVNGEAYFDVAKDGAKPFIVQKKDLSVTVLGTGFNINTYDDEQEPEVTLKDGKVKVEKKGTSLLLKPGQQAVVKDDVIGLVDNPDMQQVLAWMDNNFYFYGENIRAVMRQLARWYDIEVVFADGAPDDIRLSGMISRTVPLSQVLDVLSDLRIHSVREGNKVTIIP